MNLTTKKSVLLMAVLLSMSACSKKNAKSLNAAVNVPITESKPAQEEVKSANPASETQTTEAAIPAKTLAEETEDSLKKMSNALVDLYMTSPVEKKREELSNLLADAMLNSESFVAIDNKISENAKKLKSIIVSAFADIDMEGISVKYVTDARTAGSYASTVAVETADEVYEVIAKGQVGEVANKYIVDKITTGLLDMHEYAVDKTSVGIEKTVETSSSVWESSKRSILKIHRILVDELSNAMSNSETFQQVDLAVKNAGELYTNQLSEAMSNSDTFKKVDGLIYSSAEKVKFGHAAVVDKLSKSMSESDFFVAIDSILTGKENTNSTREELQEGYKVAYDLVEKSIATTNNLKMQASDVLYNLIVNKVWKAEANFLITSFEKLSANVIQTSDAISNSETFKVFDTEIKRLGALYRESLSQTMSESENFRKTDEYVRGVLDQIVKFEKSTRPKI